jgi:hypothetical protein
MNGSSTPFNALPHSGNRMRGTELDYMRISSSHRSTNTWTPGQFDTSQFNMPLLKTNTLFQLTRSSQRAFSSSISRNSLAELTKKNADDVVITVSTTFSSHTTATITADLLIAF